MSNKMKAIITANLMFFYMLTVLAIIAFANIIMLSNADKPTNKIEVGGEVYVVNTSISESTIINGTVVKIKYQDNETVEYSVLIPRIINSVVSYSVVIYGPVNIFLTYDQALEYALNN